jgi:hypothetical protein
MANVLGVEAIMGMGLLISTWAVAFDPSNIFVCIAIILLLAVGLNFLVCLSLCFLRKASFTKMAVYIAIFLLLIPALRVGAWARDKAFERKLPDYKQAAHVIEASLPQGVVPINRISLPADYQKLARAATAGRSADGAVTIEFITAGHFPVSHSGYLFRSDGKEDETLKHRWHALRRINANWFYFAD